MKVLQVINDLNTGGAERLLLDLIPELNKLSNIQVEILLLTDKKNVFESQLRESGTKMHVCSLRKPYDIRNIIFIRNFIKKNNFDIIHAHLFPAIYWISIAMKLIKKIPPILIMTEHNTVNRRRKYSINRIVEKFIYKEYSNIISISDKTQIELKKWLKVNKTSPIKFSVIENAVNINKFKNAIPYNRYELIPNRTENLKLICMVANLMEQKDQATLIKSLVYLENNVHLLLVGKGPTLERLKLLIKKLNLNERVHLLGARSDVERILKTVDVVVLSSNWEGFGLVAVEGMASGKPVIASDVDGLREVVKDAGLLFENKNVEQLAEKINKLLSDKNYYNEISALCIKRAEKYNLPRMVDELNKVYSSFINI